MIGVLNSMSFREKSVWVTAAIMLYMWAWYVSAVGPSLFDGTVSRSQSIGMFIGMTVMVIVLEVVGHIILAITSPKDANAPEDERDRLIMQKAESHASWMLGAGVIIITIHIMAHDISSVAVVHLLILLLIAVEVISRVLQIYFYRRGL
jgi:hypothetical protein